MKNMIRLEQTCIACPEQYDAYIGGEILGYLRLRHGWFYAEYRDEVVYETRTKGDGAFYDEEERHKELGRALNAIKKEHYKYMNGKI